jgi:hypothetical protein
MARGNIKFQNVIECLHKPIEDAYVETNNNGTNPTGGGATTLPASSTGTGTGTGKSPSSPTDAGQGSPTTSKGAALSGYAPSSVMSTLFIGAFVTLVSSLLGAAVAT